MMASQADNELLMTLVVRTKVNQLMKTRYDITPLEVMVLCYVHTYPFISPTRKQLMECKLGSKRNVQEAVQRVVELGCLELTYVSARQARRMRLTERGRVVIGELTRQIRRHTRVLERGM